MRDTVRDYLLGRLPVDNLHMLYNEKERNYRTYKAREYAMFTITHRDVMGGTERAMREDLIRDMPAVTLGREYDKLTVDLVDFLRQPSAARSRSRASRQKRHGFIMTDYDKFCRRRFYDKTRRVFDTIDTDLA